MDLNLRQWLSKGVPKGSDMIFLDIFGYGMARQLLSGVKVVE